MDPSDSQGSEEKENPKEKDYICHFILSLAIVGLLLSTKLTPILGRNVEAGENPLLAGCLLTEWRVGVPDGDRPDPTGQ